MQNTGMKSYFPPVWRGATFWFTIGWGAVGYLLYVGLFSDQGSDTSFADNVFPEWVSQYSVIMIIGLLVMGVAALLQRHMDRSKSSLEAFREAADSLFFQASENFFEILLKRLLESLDIDFVLVGELSGDEPRWIQTIAVHGENGSLKNFACALPGSPCEHVVTEGACVYEHALQGLFPGNETFRELEIDAYIGVPLKDQNGTTIGVLVGLKKSRIGGAAWMLPVMKMAAARAADELLRQRSENARAESELAYRTIVDFSPVAFYRSDENGGLTFVDQSWCELTGLGYEDAMGNGFIEAVDPEYRDAAIAAWQSAVVKGIEYKIETKLRSRRGGYRWVYSQAKPERDASGNIVGYVGVIVEISDKKRAEAALQARERELSTLVQFSPVGMFRADVGGNATYVNERWAAITGIDREDALQEGWCDTLHPEDAEFVVEKWLRCVAGETPFRLEYRWLQPDGSVKWTLAQSVPELDDKGNVVGHVGTLTDTTEQKSLELELERVRAEQKLIIENAPVGIILVRDGRVVRANEAYERITGRKISDGTGVDPETGLPALEQWWEMNFPDKRTFDNLSSEENEMLARGEMYQSDGIRVRPDGSRYHLRYVGKALDPTNLDKGVIWMAEDVTAQIKAKEELELSEEKLRALVAHSSDIISVVGANGESLFVGPSVKFVLGYDPGLLMNQDPFSLVHSEDLPKARELFNLTLDNSDQAWADEFRVRHADGTWRQFECVARNLLDEPAVRGIVLTLRDITERRQTQEALARFAAERNMVLENARISINLNKGRRVVRADAAFEKMFGWNVGDEPDGVDMELLYANADDYREVGDEVVQVLTKGQTFERETLMKRKDGSTFWCRAVGKAVNPNDLSEGSIWLAEDISDRRLAEEELRHAQKMDAVGQLTGGVAHDFNNLLAVIMFSLELIEEQIDVQPDIEVLIGRAREALKRGENLTHRLLSFSRRQALQPYTCDVNGLISGMLEIFQRTISAEIEVSTELADDIWQIKVDPSQLQDAILNLVLNSRDAIEGAGKVVIRTENWHCENKQDVGVSCPEQGNFVVISIVDTGSGMSADVMDRALEPFYTTKEVGSGSGLGLSMAYGFASQSGGHMTIQSEEGEGTCVRIHLAREEASEEVEIENVNLVELPAGGSETILVVEDDRDVRELAAIMLGSLGYKVLEARSGQDALDVLGKEHGIDLMLTDVVLPGGMNGVDLLVAARANRPQLSCVIMSGYTALPAGSLPEGIPLLKKPFRRKDLADQVSNALASVAA